MKILMIDDNFHSPLKGAPLFNMEKEYLLKMGHDVKTLSFDVAPGLLRSDNDHIVHCGRGRIKQKASKFFSSGRLKREIRELIEEVCPDVIHNHLISKYPLALFEAIPMGVPVVQTLHGPNFFCPTSWGNMKKDSSPCRLGVSLKCVTGQCIAAWQYPVILNLFSKIIPLLDKVTVFHCPSENIQKVAKRFRFDNTQIVRLGLRSIFTNINMKDHFDAKTILFIGSLHPVKGLDYLLDAVLMLVPRLPGIRLLIAGRGPYEEYYKNKVRNLGIERNVVFKGYVASENIIELFQSASISVVPSIWEEQFGMTGPESLACGTPVIASSVGGIPEWLQDGRFGFLVPPRDSCALADKIEYLLSSQEMLRQFGKAGRKYTMEVHSHDKYNAEIMGLLEDAAKTNS